MKPIDKEDTINKSILLNWLYSADKELPLSELGKWIEAVRRVARQEILSRAKQGSESNDLEVNALPKSERKREQEHGIKAEYTRIRV